MVVETRASSSCQKRSRVPQDKTAQHSVAQHYDLFVVERNQRVDAHSSPRGNIAGREGHGRKHQRHAGECERIGSAHVVEFCAKQTRKYKRRSELDKNPYDREFRAAAQHKL